jgi:hypothetical protein
LAPKKKLSSDCSFWNSPLKDRVLLGEMVLPGIWLETTHTQHTRTNTTHTHSTRTHATNTIITTTITSLNTTPDASSRTAFRDKMRREFATNPKAGSKKATDCTGRRTALKYTPSLSPLAKIFV